MRLFSAQYKVKDDEEDPKNPKNVQENVSLTTNMPNFTEKIPKTYEYTQDIEDLLPKEEQPYIRQPLYLTDIGYETQINGLTPIERFKKKLYKLSVTELTSQIWCEMQLEFYLTTGKKKETEAMRLGIERHDELERQDHEIVEIIVNSPEEMLAVRLLNSIKQVEQLLSTGIVREIWVFMIHEGFLLRGIIDELIIKNGFLYISDTKTRRIRREPSAAQKQTSAVQLQIYKYILDYLRSGTYNITDLFEKYGYDANTPLEIPELQEYQTLQHMGVIFQETLQKLPVVAETLKVVYEHEGEVFATNEIKYSEISTIYTLNNLLDWWKGARNSEPVWGADNWKCRYCDFLEQCTSTPLDPEQKIAVLESRKTITETDSDTKETSEPFKEGMLKNHPQKKIKIGQEIDVS